MIVDEFIEKPEPVSSFSNPENYWPDFLALLHLLLIKHHQIEGGLSSKNY